MDQPCNEAAWNVADAAPAMSALSGLISGFMFAGLIVLLVERQPRVPSARIPALTPFLAGFIALGLCSYQFVLISGESEQSCRRIWAATAVSSGMLAVGTVAAVSGVVLLVHAYFDRTTGALGEAAQPTSADAPERLLRVTFLSIALISEILLVGRVGEAIWVWLGLPRDWRTAGPVLVVAGIVVGFAWITAYAFGSSHRERQPSDPNIRRLNIAALLTILFSAAGTAILGALLAIVNGDWNKADSWLGWLFAVPSVVMPSFAIWLFAKGVLGMLDSWSTPVQQKELSPSAE
ncbi:hypothetical protein GA0074692_5738 [Micromonospora pallida]|uniref:Uncharacterized protein n=1 Tax=Micromonospora pallida TaxID=145854 RepID=A0A1C6TFU5_9ACTN|nr:hypothetical protein [Micromonospora pallida]SCL40325.1 hypothetical protein GA0074692_5738 [Micromonospora pallida]